jgi:basic amino acid/polyamine antiporter, APA family
MTPPVSPDQATHTPVTTRARLLSVLGVTFGLAVTVGNTIGAGILRTPGEVAAQLPSVSWYFAAWLVGGLYALLGALAIAELGAMLPQSGGQYIYARHTFGRYAGFVVGWNDWISTCGSAAAVSIVIGEATEAVIPAAAGWTRGIALASVVFFTALIWRGVRTGARTQELTSLLKALAFLALIIACFTLGERPAPDAATRAELPNGLPLLIAFVVAMQSVIYTYDGWTGVIYFSEEVRDPGRDIPRAMFGGVALVIVIYLLVNAAYLFILPVTGIGGEPLAAAAAARTVFGARGDIIVSGLLLIGMLSAVNALILMASRVIFAMSRDGLVSSQLTRVNAGGTPSIALLLSAVVAALFVITGTFASVIAVLSFFFVLNYVISFAALFVLRRREPKAVRPYRAWGYPWTTGIALAGSLAFLVATVVGDRRNGLYALGLLVLSYPVYLAVSRTTRV